MLPSQREVDKSTKPQRYAEKKIISQEDLQAFLGKILERFGGRTWARTKDPLIKSQLLYQLSYASTLPAVGRLVPPVVVRRAFSRGFARM
jgi:hypothetical protein